MSERFVSVQGEGISAGIAAAFLRLGNCNLTCRYCDTPYTWDAERFDLNRELLPEAEESVARWVVEHAPGRLIVTGGEPLLQHRRLVALLSRVDAELSSLGRARLFVEVETNGTVAPGEALARRVDQWNVSPKLKNSLVQREKRIVPEVLAEFVKLAAYFKFVVSSEEDAREVDSLRGEFGLPEERVLLMPEAIDVTELRARGPVVAAWARARGVRYSGRLHLELFGGRRGT